MAFDFDYKKAAKVTIQFIVAGACFAFALPHVCEALNFSGDFVDKLRITQTPVWSMTFFGTMGALQSVIGGFLDNVPFLHKDKKPIDISNEISISAMPPMIGAGKVQQVSSAKTTSVSQVAEPQMTHKSFEMPQLNIIHGGKMQEADKTLERA